MTYLEALEKNNIVSNGNGMFWNDVQISKSVLCKKPFLRLMNNIMLIDAYPNLEQNDYDFLNYRPPVPRKQHQVIDDSGNKVFQDTPRTGDILKDFDFKNSGPYDDKEFPFHYSHSNIFYSILRSLIFSRDLNNKDLSEFMPQCFFSSHGKEVMRRIIHMIDIRHLTLYVMDLISRQIPTSYLFISQFLDIHGENSYIHTITDSDGYYLLTAGIRWCEFAYNHMWSESSKHFDLVPRIIESFKKTGGVKHLKLSKQSYYPVLLQILNYDENLANYVVENGDMSTFTHKNIFTILLDYMNINKQRKFVSQVEFFKRLGFVPTEKEQDYISQMSGRFTHSQFLKMKNDISQEREIPEVSNRVFVFLDDFQDPEIVEKLSTVSCKDLKEAQKLFYDDSIRNTYFMQLLDHTPHLRQWYIDNINKFEDFTQPWFNRPGEQYRRKYMNMILEKRSVGEIVKLFKNDIDSLISNGTLEVYTVLNVLKNYVADITPLIEEVGEKMAQHKIRQFQNHRVF